MSKPDTDTLTLEAATGGWTRVYDGAGEHVDYVQSVKIAGCEVELEYEMNSCTVECTEWSISRDCYPALLIEAAEWYDR